jgi:hypothetical protein
LTWKAYREVTLQKFSREVLKTTSLLTFLAFLSVEQNHKHFSPISKWLLGLERMIVKEENNGFIPLGRYCREV